MFNFLLLRITIFALAIVAGAPTISPAQPAAGDLRCSLDGTGSHLTKEAVTAGSLLGTVFNDADASPQPEGIGGVRVMLRSASDVNGETRQHQISDPVGSFHFAGLPAGRYELQIDPVSVPAKFHAQRDNSWTINVEACGRFRINLPIVAERAISGVVFIDKNRNGRYNPGKDVPVGGAIVTVGQELALSQANGHYLFRDLPAGPIPILVRWPGSNQTTHMMIQLVKDPVRNRIVDIPRAP